MTLLFIVNPAAKNGKAIKVWRKLEKNLLKQSVEYKVYFTKGQKDAVQYVKSYLENTKEPVTFVAVGGDGTIHEVINGIYTFQHGIIGYIPAGSGNDFGRGFPIPSNPMKWFSSKEIHKLKKKWFDLGVFNGGRGSGVFINNLGMGFDAKVATQVNRSKVKHFLNRLSLGKLAYVYFLIKELFLFKPGTLTVKVDGKTEQFHRAWFATVCNQPYFGGGMKLSPESKPDDGELEVVVVHNISRYKILFLFMTVFWGGHTKLKEVAILKGKDIRIEGEKGLPVHADGEYIGEGPIQISANRGSVPIIVNE